MKRRIRRPLFSPVRIRAFLRGSRYFLLSTGIVTLGYVAFTLLDTKVYQAYQTRRFQQELEASQASNGKGEPVRTASLPPVEEAKPARAEGLGIMDRRGAPLGRIEIRTIGISAMIMEGVDQRTLRRAVGHIPGTPLPGQPGNVVLAGHRDTFFRALKDVREGDEITLETLNGLHRYRVDSTEVVGPGETRVLDSSDDSILTLVTCYPFSFVGPAPERFVVRAHKVVAVEAGPAVR